MPACHWLAYVTGVNGKGLEGRGKKVGGPESPILLPLSRSLTLFPFTPAMQTSHWPSPISVANNSFRCLLCLFIFPRQIKKRAGKMDAVAGCHQCECGSHFTCFLFWFSTETKRPARIADLTFSHVIQSKKKRRGVVLRWRLLQTV